MPGDGDGCSHKIHVVASSCPGLETHHLVRLMREADYKAATYVWKSFRDFEVLMDQLQNTRGIELLPEAHDKWQRGLRRALSLLLSNSNASSDEAERLEMSINFVLGQVTSFRDIPSLVDFFSTSRDGKTNNSIRNALGRLRSEIGLLSIAGFWTPAANPSAKRRVWSLSEDGTAHLNCHYYGAEFDVHEGPDRNLLRNDGWAVDMDRSASKEKLIWIKSGQPAGEISELVWTRLSREEAQPILDRADKSRKEAETNAAHHRECEKERIRAIILERVKLKREADNARNKTGIVSEPITRNRTGSSEASTRASSDRRKPATRSNTGRSVNSISRVRFSESDVIVDVEYADDSGDELQ